MFRLNGGEQFASRLGGFTPTGKGACCHFRRRLWETHGQVWALVPKTNYVPRRQPNSSFPFAQTFIQSLMISSLLKVLFWRHQFATHSIVPVPVAARSKAWVYNRSLAGIVGSNPTEGMDVCLFWVLYVVRCRSLRRADQSSGGVLPNVLRRCGWSRNLVNEEALTHWRLSRQKQTHCIVL